MKIKVKKHFISKKAAGILLDNHKISQSKYKKYKIKYLTTQNMHYDQVNSFMDKAVQEYKNKLV